MVKIFRKYPRDQHSEHYLRSNFQRSSFNTLGNNFATHFTSLCCAAQISTVHRGRTALLPPRCCIALRAQQCIQAFIRVTAIFLKQILLYSRQRTSVIVSAQNISFHQIKNVIKRPQRDWSC